QTHTQPAAIFASGASISRLNPSEEVHSQPAILLHGSLALSTQHEFKSKVADVISDARFIEHAPQIFSEHYQAQPLFITQTVLEKILALNSNLIDHHKYDIYLIQPIDRPFNDANASFLSKLLSKKKLNLPQIQDPETILDLQ